MPPALRLLPALALAALVSPPIPAASSQSPPWDWSRTEPQVAWRAEVGAGFAQVAVHAGTVFAMGNRNDEDRVTALDATTGTIRWEYRYPARALGLAQPDERGPRATPVVHAGGLFTLSRDGRILCLDPGTGTLRWWRDIPAETGERPPYWGYSGSPLPWDEHLIWNIGERGLALRADTGAVVWKSEPRTSEVWKNEPVGVSGYISPAPVEFRGRRLVGLANEARWLVIDPATGAELWSAPWETPYGVNAAQPAVVAGHVALSGGYGFGIRWVSLDGIGSPVWTNQNLRSHFAPVVAKAGHLFGIDGNQQDGSKCALRCIDPASGEIRWSREDFGFANLTLVENLLLLLTARGELVLVQADPSAYRELGRLQVLGGESWTAPLVADGAVFARNKQGTLVRVRLPAADPPASP